MVKKKSDKKGGSSTKSTMTDHRSMREFDLFSWTDGRHVQKAGRSRSKDSKVVNIDDIRIERAKRQDAQSSHYRRSYHGRGLGSIVPKLTRQAVGSKSSLDANLQIYWREIVGDDFATNTYPRKSRFDQLAKRLGGVLELTVERGYGAVIVHAKHQLLDKLNAYSGSETFRDVKIKEGPLPIRREASRARRANSKLLSTIDLNDRATRQRLGIVTPVGVQNAPKSNRSSLNWMPKPPRRHRLDLTMDDGGGTGVTHKPLAEALTFLGASLVNQDQQD